MIVVVGSPIAIPISGAVGPGGLGADIALEAARSGGTVQVVGRVGEDAAGDQVLLGLAAAGVGHVAVLREATHSTPAAPPGAGESAIPDGPDPGEALLAADEAPDADRRIPDGLSMDSADLELALRYLPDYRVLILAADLEPPALATVIAAAAWSGAHFVALVGPGDEGTGLPDNATVFQRPSNDHDGTFAQAIAAFAVALDRGDEPKAAFRRATATAGWAAVAD